MPRKRRIWFPGAQYHIMCRGNHRAEIYREEEDRQVYLSLLEETRNKYPFGLISYCLMSNHVHLQIETIDTEPGMFMKMLNMKYAIYFNKKYNFVGHLFQGRYRSELIESDSQLLQTSKYIHLNPVRANIVGNPSMYEWSSYREYLKELSLQSRVKYCPVVLNTGVILRYFKNNSTELYKAYVEYELSLYNPSKNTDDAVSAHAGSAGEDD